MSCCGFQDITGISLEESQLITSNQLYNDILINSNYTFISSNSNIDFTTYSCNQLSNLIQPQLDERSNLIYKDSNLNTIVKLTAQNPFYPISGDQKEIRFYTAENEHITRINQEGGLEVYHPLRIVPIPIDYPAAWWNVEEKLTFVIQDGIGLRFDVTNLQAGSGIGTITNEAEATAAAVASGAGLVGLGGVTGAAASTIAGGDYGTAAIGVAGGALFSVLGYLSYQAQVGCNLSNLGFSNQFSNVNSNMSNANLLLTSNLYSISRGQGFINCNILSQQFVNDLKVSSLNLNNGNLTNLNTINGITGIFGSISTTNNANEAIPSKTNFGGLGDKIIIKTGTSTTYPYSIGIENKALWISGEDNIKFYNRGINSLSLTSNNSTQIFGELLCNSNLKLNQTNISNIFVASNLLSNININHGFLNSNITNQQYISNLKCDNLNLNTGNINNINGISTNELIASGKIKQNNILLDNIYLNSNHIYNLSFNYTAEREYPPKAFTSVSPEGSVSLLGNLVYREILFLDTSIISYGSGFYEVFSSSTFDINTQKSKLFNYILADTINARFGINQYNSGTGNYQGGSYIKNDYYGDWIIIKTPQPILLTKFRFYTGDTTTRCPAEWKCYGSSDGIIFNEISEGSQSTRLVFGNYSLGYYEKTIASTFTTQYNYFGFVVNKIVSVSGNTDLCFGELRLWGKEILSNSIVSNIYTTSNAVKYITLNEQPNLNKKYAFYCQTNNLISPNGVNSFYAYHLYLPDYTKTGYIDIGSGTGDTYRIFNIKCFYGTSYFQRLTNGQPNICSYTIYMSNKAVSAGAGSGTIAGINIMAIGQPQNYYLDNLMNNDLFILRNNSATSSFNWNYISILTPQIADVRVFIEDLLN